MTGKHDLLSNQKSLVPISLLRFQTSYTQFFRSKRGAGGFFGPQRRGKIHLTSTYGRTAQTSHWRNLGRRPSVAVCTDSREGEENRLCSPVDRLSFSPQCLGNRGNGPTSFPGAL